MILSFFPKKTSPFLYVQFAAHPGEKKQYERTPIRKDDPNRKSKMASYRLQLEARMTQTGAGETGRGIGWEWVIPYLRSRYIGKVRTLQVYNAQWQWLSRFFFEHDLRAPIQLTREHCFQYVDWRTNPTKEKSGRQTSVNTAIGELKLLGLLMDEATTRGLTVSNPARRLGIEREEPREKPAMTDHEIAIITAALEHEPQWMRRAFHLALRTGLRHAETQLHRSQVDWANNRVIIQKPKGGRRKAFGIELYESIHPLLREWCDTDEPWFWHLPPKERSLTGLRWTKFFRKIRLPHLCFHCTRVTFISRGALAGIPEGMMMALVNHGSVDVHRVYQRLSPEGAARLVAKIGLPAMPATG